MKTLWAFSSILLTSFVLTSNVLADNLTASTPEQPSQPMAYASAKELNDQAPYRYCKVLPPHSDSPICEEECCQAPQKEMPMSDCHTFAFPCQTPPPL